MRARQTFSTLACTLLVGSAVVAGSAAPAANAAETTTQSEATVSATVSAADINVASVSSLPSEATITSASATDRAALAAKIDAVIDSNSKALQQLEAATLEGLNSESSTAAAAEKANKDYESKSAQVEKVNNAAYAKLALANGTSASAEKKRSEARLAAAADAELEAATTQAPLALDNTTSPLADPFGTQTTQAGAQGASVASLGSAANLGTSVSTALAKTYATSWATRTANNNYYLYKYGYVGPRYFDCSAFTKTAMAKSAITIPRTSSMQYAGSRTKVSLSNLRVGDLIFWTSNGGRSFYHVAMYIGNGNIVHARNPTAGISVTKMNYAGMTNIYRYGVRY